MRVGIFTTQRQFTTQQRIGKHQLGSQQTIFLISKAMNRLALCVHPHLLILLFGNNVLVILRPKPVGIEVDAEFANLSDIVNIA